MDSNPPDVSGLPGLDGPTASRARLLPLLAARLRPDPRPVEADVWVQAVSVGEVGLAATFAGALSALRPATRFLVTSTTPAGVALLPRRFPQGAVLRPFPLDLPGSVRRFLDRKSLRLLVLVETELWPVLLGQARRRGLPVLVVNGRLSERSLRRLCALPPLLRKPLAALSHVAARSEADAGRFAAIGVPPDRVTVAGDLKLDGTDPAPPVFGERLRVLAGTRPVLVAGSIAEDEVPLVLELLRLLRESGPAPLLLLAPRQPSTFDAVARAVAGSGLALARRSTPGDGPADVFLLDTLGELASCYLLGDVALLGGTFADKGGHNVLEPLRAGLATVVGPSTWNIRDAVAAAGEAVVAASSAAEAAAAIRTLLASPGRRAAAREAARALFAGSRGAAERAARIALTFLEGR